mgnify:CR=1 FL=1
MGLGQEETSVFKTEVVVRHCDWGLWLLAILGGLVLLKKL